MGRPHLLLVDDSEAVLAYGRAALSAHYDLSTATNGREALHQLRTSAPDAVLLDLSMPEMDGDEVLRVMQADVELRTIPVIVVSSELVRGQACLARGAAAFIPKPVRAEPLRTVVGRVLDEAGQARRQAGRAVLFAQVGAVEVGIPLEAIRAVVLQPMTRKLLWRGRRVTEVFDYQGEPVAVLDAERALGAVHQADTVDRTLAVLAVGDSLLALPFDRIRDPEEIPPEDLSERPTASREEGERDAVGALVRTPRGWVPLLQPGALLSRRALARLSSLLAEARR